MKRLITSATVLLAGFTALAQNYTITNAWSGVSGDRANVAAFSFKATAGVYPNSINPVGSLTSTFPIGRLTLTRPIADATTPAFGTTGVQLTDANTPVYIDIYTNFSGGAFSGYVGSSSSSVLWSSTVAGASYSFDFSGITLDSTVKYWFVFSENNVEGDVANFRIRVNTSGADTTPGPGRGYLTGDTVQAVGATGTGGTANQDWGPEYKIIVGPDYGAPVVSVNPASINNAVAGTSVEFFASFSNYAWTYQWYKDGEIIPGATATNYVIPSVSKANEGSYVLWATNIYGTAAGSTLAATLTVADSVAPTLVSATSSYSLQNIRVQFSEPVSAETATNTANYSITGGASIIGVTVVNLSTVDLITSDLGPNSSRTLTITGVQDLAGNSIASGATASFTTPNLTVSSVLYNAGTTSTHPAGAPDPALAEGNYWIFSSNVNPGFTAASVSGDYGTDLNAWAMADANINGGSGVYDYRMKVDAASDNLARSNGWRFLVHTRLAYDGTLSGTISAPVFLYSHPGAPRRYGVQFSYNTDTYVLTANLLGGGSYALQLGDPLGYHTHVIAFDPATTNASYYVDGVLIAANYAGDTGISYDGVAFGMGSSTGIGQMNFNRVQLDVVGGVQPAVVSSPESRTVGVGQQVVFTAEFTPFVAAFQWLTNGVIVPNAGGTSWTVDYTTMPMNGMTVKCRALHPAGNVETATAILTVTDDITPPTILSVQGSMLLDRVTITYSEHVDPQYATNVANYNWGAQAVANVSARMVDAATVELRTTKQQPNTSYTVLVSNVRDVSNLLIANNSPATFKTPKLVTVAKYDAGTTVTRPSGPPAPESVEGGSWINNSGTDAGLITNAIVDDNATGLNAWQVTDNTTAAAQFIQYNFPQTLEQDTAHRANGWVLTVYGRFVDDFSASGSDYCVLAQYGNSAGQRHLIWFDHDATDQAWVWLFNTASGVIGAGTDYHLHQIVYNPATTNASYYCNGELEYSGWAGDVSAYTYAGVQWGTGTAANQGSMNFNLVEFQVVPAPAVPTLSITPNGANVDVSFTGILETTGDLNGTWTAVSTNATEVPVVLPIAAGQPKQFFRARGVEE